MATGGQFYWPSVGTFVAAYGQFFMAAYSAALSEIDGAWIARQTSSLLVGPLRQTSCTLCSMAKFRVHVPFEPVLQEDLQSSVISGLPDTDLPHGITLRRNGETYTTEIEVLSQDPRTAKLDAIRLVEDFLAILAAWNCAFQVRISGIRAEVVERDQGIVFIESHFAAVAQRGDLVTEAALFERRHALPEYLKSCLELNYLLVLSSRPENRWLLAATGMEALAVGALGDQPRVSKMLTKQGKRELCSNLRSVLSAAGLGEVSDRVINSVFYTTRNRVPDHVQAFLSTVSIRDVPFDEIEEWWRKRGNIAHGQAVELDSRRLQQLIDVFQKALRRAAGAEVEGR